MNRAADFLAGRADLALIGLRGSGKSTIGRGVAARLGREFVDTDVSISLHAGQSIAEIFRAQGEAAFRDIEAEIVRNLLRGTGRVVALGGGAILNGQTRERLKECAATVWLHAEPRALRQRLSTDVRTPEARPSLTGAPVLDEIEAVLMQREPLYRAAADIVVDTSVLTPEQSVAAVISALQPASNSPRPSA